jgi:outer membrane biosynthesis protein TonB
VKHLLLAILVAACAHPAAQTPPLAPPPAPSSQQQASSTSSKDSWDTTGGQVRGSLDKEIIRRVIRRHIDEVTSCYEKGAELHPHLGGRLVVQFIIGSEGHVTQSRVESSTLNDLLTDNCIANALLSWEFPKPQGGGRVIVSYPFVLSMGGEDTR